MKNILLILLLAFTLPAMASESKYEKIDELMSLMDADAMFDSMYSQMEAMLKNLSTEFGVQPDEQEIFDSHYSKMIGLMKSEMSWDKLKDPTIEIYRKTFTEAEIDGMLKFYKSEIGQSTLKKLPAIMQESMKMSQTLVKEMMPKIQALSADLRSELETKRTSN